MILGLVLLVLAFPIAAEPKNEEGWINYSGHNMSFEYPVEWNLTENPTGVTVGIERAFAFDISMHKEGCYPLSQHPQLLSLLILMHSKAVDGTPDGSPAAQYSENEIGPYSMAIQNYKNPAQSLKCEIQGYAKRNITVFFTETLWKPQDTNASEINPKIDRLKESLIVTLPDNANISSVQA
ncbi:MAG: hypothetical protein ACE14P_07845 [Methanotrichaceae archaeon]